MSLPQPAETLRSRGRLLTDFIAGALQREYPEAVRDAARRAFVDYLGVSLGAMQDPPVRAVRGAVRGWGAPDAATVFLGFRTAPALAALVNGTATHSQDYDDTHPLGTGHPSGPCWSAAIAMSEHLGSREADMLAAFITGYEVMAKLGGGGVKGVGRALQRHGFHPTSVFGRPAAAAVTAVLLGLDEHQIACALGNAATTAGGLVGSFGTHGKPFHAGKAAMDGIMAAQFAAEGFEASTALYELEGGLLSACIQDRSANIPDLSDFGTNWEILGNGFKLFASCRATHASTEAAARLAQVVSGRPIARVHVRTHGNALVTAGKLNPQTPLEGKFSVPFCVALGLTGRSLVPADFSEANLRDPRIVDLLAKTVVEAVVGQPPYEAHVEVFLEDGEHLRADTAILRGHPDNPLSWSDLESKFKGLVAPVIGAGPADELFEIARGIDQAGALRRAMTIVGPRP